MFLAIVGALLFVFVGIPVIALLTIRFWKVGVILLIIAVLGVTIPLSEKHLEDKRAARELHEFYAQQAREKGDDPLGIRDSIDYSALEQRIINSLESSAPETEQQNYFCLQGC